MYLAVCAGVPDERIAIAAPIGRHPTNRLKMAAVPPGQGREAHSVVRRLASDGRRSLVAVLLRTGRTHQIRVHMAHVRCPVLGDQLYGDAAANKRERRRAPRQLLHSYYSRVAHPLTGAPLAVTAPPPPDLAAAAASLAGCDEGALGAWLEPRVLDAFAEELAAFRF